MKKLLLFILLILISLTKFSFGATTCPENQPLSVDYKNADTVFIGKAVIPEKSDRDLNSPYIGAIHVSKVLKGRVPSKIKHWVCYNDDWSSCVDDESSVGSGILNVESSAYCGIIISRNNEYLFFATKNGKNLQVQTAWSSTGLLTERLDVLKEIQEIKTKELQTKQMMFLAVLVILVI